jgi:hypothetical protein
MSTAQEIEDAIRALPAPERDKLMRDIPNLFPEFADAEWQAIIDDERTRPALKKLLDNTETELRQNPGAFPEMTARDFNASP